MAQIDELLKLMLDRRGSDLHLRSAHVPIVRVHGEVAQLPHRPALCPEECEEMIYEIMPARNRDAFTTDMDTDFAYEVPELGRFRVNVLRDRFGIGAVLRTIPSTPLTADQLDLPLVVRDFCYLKKGLVLVTGPTGSGKSTTLAAMIDLINRTRADHIITIEDPLEFIHQSRRCVVTQREMYGHTKSFASALRAALREDPDIVLVGEMRDLETTEIAIETAETGHLVFGTLHTNTAATTVDRIIDKFPADRQNQIRTMLASSLKGVISQTLCKRADGKGRVAAMEILVTTPAISSQIREAKTFQIPSAMQVGKAHGMQLLDDALFELLKSGTISLEEAHARAQDKDTLTKKAAVLGMRLALPVPAKTESGNGTAVRELMERRQTVINSYLETIWKEPDNPELLNRIAWLLATGNNPDPTAIDRALILVERANALANGQHAGILDTMGAAYARSGRFDVALNAARRGLDLARVNKQTDLAAALEKRIKLYERGEPMRE